jgi:hypothetical protein
MKKPDLSQDCCPIIVYALSGQFARIIERENAAKRNPHAPTGRRQTTPLSPVCSGNRDLENHIVLGYVSALDGDM